MNLGIIYLMFNPGFLFFFIFPQCHSGIMGGGHYVTYAKNPNNKWYCYNDSSCKVKHFFSSLFHIIILIISNNFCLGYPGLKKFRIRNSS